jgi:CheY-like chemotaxis protein
MATGKQGSIPKKQSKTTKQVGGASTRAARPVKLAKTSLEPKQILITDDEQYLREMLASQLQEKGYQCISLASKADAYKWSVEHKPDLIITDVNSPGMDGFQFLRLIKSHSTTGKVPVVFLTGLSSSETVEQAKRPGAAEFVTKPCSLADVQSVVERVLMTRPPGRAR